MGGPTGWLDVTDSIRIDERELHYTFQRSGGPGGQNVNKVATRVSLAFAVNNSACLTDEQKACIRRRLANRLSRAGVLRVVSSRYRTQAANRRAARQRLAELLAEALRPVTPRRKTRVSRAAKARRLSEKRLHGERKRERRGNDWQ